MRISRNGQRGFIFLCTRSTVEECLRSSTFGALARDKEFYFEVSQGDFIFLYDYDDKILYGVFQAMSKPYIDYNTYYFQGRYPLLCSVKLISDEVVTISREEFYPFVQWVKRKPIPLPIRDDKLFSILSFFNFYLFQ